MPRFLNKWKEKQSKADPKKDDKTHVSVPNEPLLNPEPAPNPEPDNEPRQLQARLWNEAYEQLKSSNSELVESYEKILSRELLRGQHDSSEPTSLENRIDAAYDGRWKQMQVIVEAALERKKKRSEKRQKIGGGLAAVRTTMSQAVRAVPEAAVAWTGVCFALEMVLNSVQEARANHEGILYVVSRMEWYWHLAELLLDNNTNISAPSALRVQLEKHIIDLYQKLLFYQMKTVCRYYRQHGPAILRDAIKADNWAGQLDDVRNAEAIVQEDSRIFNALEIQRRLDEIDSASRMLQNEIQDIWPKIQEHILSKEEERCLKDLRVTDPRDDKSRIEDTNGGLLQGAYGWAIKHTDFIAWRDEKANHLLWIKGDAGKGKTMLLCGIIDELQNRNLKPCYFFCQATDPRLNSATAILRGLIYLLVDTNRQLLSHIQEKYDHAGAALFQDANSWIVLSQMFTKLLEDPSLEGQVFMIDALDECQTDLERLLDLLAGKSVNSHAKWIVSSRNWTGIEAKIGTISQKIRFSLELNEESVSEAVSFFVAHKTAQLKEAKGLDDETELLVRNYLTDHARGTFLWVSLVCKQLSKMEVRKRHVVKKMAEFPSDLGPLYERMMHQIRESEDSDLCERILRLVAVVYRPISLAELTSLLDIEDEFNREDVKEIVASCGSFLVIKDDVVRFVHQSAQDFLFKDEMFISGLGSQHYTVFSRSLDILSATLRRDMYNLRHPGALIEEYTPNQDQHALRHAQYSCIYWVDHLKAVNDLEKEKCMLALQDDGIVHHFFSEKLLNWLEALSLLRKMPDAARVARILKKLGSELQSWQEDKRSLASTQTTYDECKMRNLIEDVYRFVLSHKVGIEHAPLQVYSSALIFSPSCSIIRQMYEETEGPKWIITTPTMPVEWTARLLTLEGHEAVICELKFSPDGTQLASGSIDETAKIWNLETGACMHTFNCLDAVDCVAFSPDGKYLATGPGRGVKIWDLITSTCLFTFHTRGPVYNLAFSFDSAHLAVSFRDTRLFATGHFVLTWDVNKGVKLKTHTLGTQSCESTVFAPDETLLACVTKERLVGVHPYIIWNLSTGRQLPALDMDGGKTQYGPKICQFSPDAAQLAVAANNRIWIYDTSTGACRQRIGHPQSEITAVFFLAASTRLMTKSQGCFGIWDSITGACLRQLDTGRPIDLSSGTLAVPSPDGILIAEASEDIWNLPVDNRIIIWDMAINSSIQTSESSTATIEAMVFSPDGTQLAILFCRSVASKIEIRDTITGARLKQFERVAAWHCCMTFFPDGKRLASGGDTCIEIWDISSAKRLQTINSRIDDDISNNYLGLMAISSDGNILAATFFENFTGRRVELWDLTTGKSLGMIYSPKERIYNDDRESGTVAVEFSPDNTRINLILASGDVRVFDRQKNMWLPTFHNFFEPLEDYSLHLNMHIWTEWGIFNHDSSVNNSSSSTVATGRLKLVEFTVSRDRTWIQRRKHRVLWLPPEYQPTAMAVYNGHVIIGCKRGQVLRFQFDVGELDKALA